MALGTGPYTRDARAGRLAVTGLRRPIRRRHPMHLGPCGPRRSSGSEVPIVPAVRRPDVPALPAPRRPARFGGPPASTPPQPGRRGARPGPSRTATGAKTWGDPCRSIGSLVVARRRRRSLRPASAGADLADPPRHQRYPATSGGWPSSRTRRVVQAIATWCRMTGSRSRPTLLHEGRSSSAYGAGAQCDLRASSRRPGRLGSSTTT